MSAQPATHPVTRSPHRGRSGQALVEYALILALVSVVAISVLLFLGVQLRAVYTTILDALDIVRAAI